MKCLMDVKWVCVSEPRMVVLVWLICVSLLSIERLADHNPKKKKPKRLDKTKGGITLTWICFFPQPTFLPLLLRELNWFSVFYRFRHHCKPIDWVTTKRKVIHLHQSMKNNLAFSFFLWLLVSWSFHFNNMLIQTLNRCV